MTLIIETAEATARVAQAHSAPVVEALAAIAPDLRPTETFDPSEKMQFGGDLVAVDLAFTKDVFDLFIISMGVAGGVVAKEIVKDVYTAVKGMLLKLCKHSNDEGEGLYGKTGLHISVSDQRESSPRQTDERYVTYRVFLDSAGNIDTAAVEAALKACEAEIYTLAKQQSPGSLKIRAEWRVEHRFFLTYDLNNTASITAALARVSDADASGDMHKS